MRTQYTPTYNKNELNKIRMSAVDVQFRSAYTSRRKANDNFKSYEQYTMKFSLPFELIYWAGIIIIVALIIKW